MTQQAEQLLFEQSRRLPTWVIFLVLPGAITGLAVLIVLSATGRLPWLVPIGLFLFEAALIVFMLAVRIRIALTNAAFYVNVRPWMLNRRLPLADITAATICNLNSSARIRASGRATTVNHGAPRGVELTLKSGRVLRIGCDEPELLIERLASATSVA